MQAGASWRMEPRRTSLAAPTLPRDATLGTSRDLPEGAMTRRQADLALLLATALWGTSFVAVKSALADATPFAFLTVRFGVAALALAPGTRFRPRPAGRELWSGVLLAAVVAALATALFERPHIHWTPRFTGALLYTVLFASTVCFLLQMRAQREMSSARAALIFCFEPLFAASTSWLVLGERLSMVQWGGGALILVGMVVAEPPQDREQRRLAP